MVQGGWALIPGASLRRAGGRSPTAGPAGHCASSVRAAAAQWWPHWGARARVRVCVRVCVWCGVCVVVVVAIHSMFAERAEDTSFAG